MAGESAFELKEASVCWREGGMMLIAGVAEAGSEAGWNE